MNFNQVSTGITLIGTTIKTINIENNLTDAEQDAKRSIGLNINEPIFQKTENQIFSQMIIDFEIEIQQSEELLCKIEMSLEGAFLSDEGIEEEQFRELVIVNGAASLIGIARGKIEAITGSVFNSGKVIIPFINVIDYYKSLKE